MKVTPELLVDNIAGGVEFYTKHLGFTVVVQTPESDPYFVTLARDKEQIMFYRRDKFTDEFPEFADIQTGGSFVLHIEVTNITQLYETMKDTVLIIKSLQATSYGTLEFCAKDPNGYKLMFAQRVD